MGRPILYSAGTGRPADPSRPNRASRIWEAWVGPTRLGNGLGSSINAGACLHPLPSLPVLSPNPKTLLTLPTLSATPPLWLNSACTYPLTQGGAEAGSGLHRPAQLPVPSHQLLRVARLQHSQTSASDMHRPKSDVGLLPRTLTYCKPHFHATGNTHFLSPVHVTKYFLVYLSSMRISYAKGSSQQIEQQQIFLNICYVQSVVLNANSRDSENNKERMRFLF